jgi:hypothetical protein
MLHKNILDLRSIFSKVYYYHASFQGSKASYASFIPVSHCIAFPGSKVRQNDCRMWNMSHKYKNIYTVQLKFSRKKTQWFHVRLFKNTSIYMSIQQYITSTYAIYTYMDESFLGYKYSSTEWNECVSTCRFSAILNRAFFHKTFEIRRQITVNFDPSIICAFRNAWEVNSWFMEIVRVSCVNKV